MKSRTTRNIQIEKQTRRVLRKATATRDTTLAKTKRRGASNKAKGKKSAKK